MTREELEKEINETLSSTDWSGDGRISQKAADEFQKEALTEILEALDKYMAAKR